MAERQSYRQVWARREYRVLFVATLVSVAGDQFARVGLSVLVYDRTRSAGLTALTYALTYLPDVLAGPLLSGLADRWPRRRVMIIADLTRAVLVALMAIPGIPLAVVAGLLVLVQAAGAPGNAARAAVLVAVLPDADEYVLGKGAMDMVVQLAQVGGFAGGGALVAGVGAGDALVADAATFAVSAAVVWFGIARRPVPVADGVVAMAGLARWWSDVSAGTRLVLTTPRLRALVGLACVAAFSGTVEGLAAPYAAGLGSGAAAVGLLLAASPAGAVLGMALVSRLPAAVRDRLMAPLALAACLPLVVCFVRPSLGVTVALWAISGAASAYHLPASAAFVRAVPDHRRGQAFGLAATALKTSQGLGIAAAGLAADRAPAAVVVAVAGGLGSLAASRPRPVLNPVSDPSSTRCQGGTIRCPAGTTRCRAGTTRCRGCCSTRFRARSWRKAFLAGVAPGG
ncbi:MFS transporter [Amycolatopsis sp. H20-H5]|uniref:MFS transporter n=1 Tax=Amycolatopsis sp. H20-H5 TaxID=3046309 RepID=UPI002DB7B970|nr:MFS transporter [Amycolatopsis sp. H20-H5]MEC3977312.1 MFS transporter [Amycolatopsis sp. H20-H5]